MSLSGVDFKMVVAMHPPTGAPFFSIIIPTYNRAYLIEKALSSVLRQRYSSYEVIVVDDGSTDGTEAVVKAVANEKVVLYKKLNGERGAARNYGWQRARGRYVTFLDSDDQLYPQHLQKAFDELQRLNYPACFAQAFEIKDQDSGTVVEQAYKTKSVTINHELFRGNFLACFGVFIQREIFTEVRFEEERKLAGSEDWLLWLQLAARHPFYFSNAVTGALIHHNERSVLSINEESLIFRPSFIKTTLAKDPHFVGRFGNRGVRRAYAHLLSYASLHLTISKKNKKAFHFLLETFKAYPGEVFKKRTLGIIKTVLFK